LAAVPLVLSKPFFGIVSFLLKIRANKKVRKDTWLPTAPLNTVKFKPKVLTKYCGKFSI